MIECLDETLSVATIYSPTKKRSMPHIMRWQNKLLRVREVSFRQLLDEHENLINAHSVVAESGLQLELRYNSATQLWCVEQH